MKCCFMACLQFDSTAIIRAACGNRGFRRLGRDVVSASSYSDSTRYTNTRSQREMRSVLCGVSIPCKTSCNVSRTNRTVIAERELDAERLVDAVDVTHAKLDQRRRLQIDHDKVSLAFRRNGANS